MSEEFTEREKLSDPQGGRDNLKEPWQKGQSGNPAGRKPGLKDGLRAHYNRWVQKNPDSDVMAFLKGKKVDLEDGTNAEALVSVIGNAALHGDWVAAKFIHDQTEAPLPKEINLGGHDGGPIESEITYKIIDPKESDKE